MTQYLLAAEADQIQDFIFRASRLREVVGGSQLLTRFCMQVPDELLAGVEADIIIRDGGSFRIVFENAKTARDFGADLAEVYHRVADGTLTVAEPVEIADGDFARASNEAEEKLREAKRWRRVAEATPQMPYIAFCASCGVGLAVTYEKHHPDDLEERPNYLCRACQVKSLARENEQEGDFLWRFKEAVVGDSATQYELPHRPKRVSCYDPRRYVAYLVADGNNMGQVFGSCNQGQMKDLSHAMPEMLRNSLAQPTKQLMKVIKDKDNFIPVLPLILGGDDVFALLPAPWALDFARVFCLEFEAQMRAFVVKNNLSNSAPSDTLTVSAAVVICKETYPYALAHRAGEARLKRAKQVSKSLAYHEDIHLSTIDFEVILGSQAAVEEADEKTLRPYWVLPDGQEMPTEANGWGLPLEHLIRQRWELRHLPGKRQAQLRRHLAHLPSPVEREQERKEWTEELERLLKRIDRDQVGQILRKALAQLGDTSQGWLYRVNRRNEERSRYSHGLPDLLDTWDFAFDLTKTPGDYDEEV